MRPFLVAALYIAFVLAVAAVALSAQSDASRALPSSDAPFVNSLREGGPDVTAAAASAVNVTAVPTTVPSASNAAGASPAWAVTSPSASPVVSARPTSLPRPSLVGTATYYTPQPGWFGAAGPALRRALGDWRGRTVMVCGFLNGQSRCHPILLSDWCACGLGHVIDLTESAWSYVCGLPLSRGTCKVTVEVLP